jgi:hydroxymethylbilane synthase
MKAGKLRLGTRSSKLSLAQTVLVVRLLKSTHPSLEVDVIPIKTLGDRLAPDQRASIDEKTAFTQDIEDLLLAGVLDLAVHSLKDLPSVLREGLSIRATPPREDARDALVSSKGEMLNAIPKGGKIGTSSLRRRAQLLRMRRDLDVIEIRGNVETRLQKIVELGLNGVVLAAAGLKRIHEQDRISQVFSVYEMVPAPGQGILAVETRNDDGETALTISAIDDPNTRFAANCERAFANTLGGDCNVPLGCYAEVSGGRIAVTGMIASPDGVEFLKKSIMGAATEPERAGEELAQSLLASGGKKILEAEVQ